MGGKVPHGTGEGNSAAPHSKVYHLPVHRRGKIHLLRGVSL